MMSLAWRIVLLVALWLLAWGNFSLVNVMTGVVLAVVLLTAFPRLRSSGTRVQPLGALRLIGYLLVQLVPANAQVAKEIVRPRAQVHTGVIAHPVPGASDELLALIANVIALTPGTMTVEVTPEPPVVYVHFLRLDDVDRARRTIARLEARCRAALAEAPPADHRRAHLTLEEPS